MSHKLTKVSYSMSRNTTVLRSRHVSGLEKSGVDRSEFTVTILDFNVYNSGDAKVVHLQGEDKDVPQVSSMAAR